MFLASKFDNTTIELIIENKRENIKREVKLPGIMIEDKLSFNKHINNLHNIASNCLRALTKVRKYLSTEQAKRLSVAYVM